MSIFGVLRCRNIDIKVYIKMGFRAVFGRFKGIFQVQYKKKNPLDIVSSGF